MMKRMSVSVLLALMVAFVSVSALPKSSITYGEGGCAEIGMTGSPAGTCPNTTSTVTTFLPDSKYCHLYHICDNAVPICKYCPNYADQDGVLSPLHWNKLVNVCDYPPNAKCTL